MTDDPTAPNYLNEDHIKALIKQFMQAVYLVCREMSRAYSDPAIAPANVRLSQHDIRLAFNEARSDLRFLLERRRISTQDLHTKGLAEGKVAGILAFRLLRGRIVHVKGDGAYFNNRNVSLIQPLAVLRLVTEAVLEIDLTKKPFIRVGSDGAEHQWLVTELLYLILRRHYNQESLALVFEMAVASRDQEPSI